MADVFVSARGSQTGAQLRDMGPYLPPLIQTRGAVEKDLVVVNRVSVASTGLQGAREGQMAFREVLLTFKRLREGGHGFFDSLLS